MARGEKLERFEFGPFKKHDPSPLERGERAKIESASPQRKRDDDSRRPVQKKKTGRGAS